MAEAAVRQASGSAPSTNWAAADFEDPEKKAKFLALMGARRSPAAAASVGSEVRPDGPRAGWLPVTPGQGLAAARIEERNLELEASYQQALHTHRGAAGGTGLGFGGS